MRHPGLALSSRTTPAAALLPGPRLLPLLLECSRLRRVQALVIYLVQQHCQQLRLAFAHQPAGDGDEALKALTLKVALLPQAVLE